MDGQLLTTVLLPVILAKVTKRIAISLPDDLYRDIERARGRVRKDRSTWIQEAASDYLTKKSRAEEVEAYFAGYERAPLDEDELAAIRWNEEHISEVLDAQERPTRARRR